MLKITDTVKVISKTNCGGIMKELIPVGTICIIVSEHKGKDGSIYYGVTPLHNRNDLFYYLESELEKGSLQWVKESESPSGSEENGHVVWVTAKPLVSETLLKQTEKIPDFAEKMNEICCGTMTSYDESTWIAPYIISTIRECKTDREFEIANTMLTCCCGASFESLINQIIDQDLLTSLIGKTFAAKLFLDELQNIFEQKYGFELCWDNKETEVWDGKEYRKMNFHCWHPQNTSKKNYVATISSCRSHGKRRINMSTYGNDWIITFSNSEDTDVFFWRFFGTEEEVKEKLVTLAKEHSTDTESDLLQCPDSAGDVEENTETCALFCTVGYEDYDYVFTAMDFRAMNHI